MKFSIKLFLVLVFFFISTSLTSNVVFAEETGFRFPTTCWTNGSSCENLKFQDNLWNSWINTKQEDIVGTFEDFRIPDNAIVDEIQVKLRVQAFPTHGWSWYIQYSLNSGFNFIFAGGTTGCSSRIYICIYNTSPWFNEINSPTFILPPFIIPSDIISGAMLNTSQFRLKAFQAGGFKNTDVDTFLVNIKYHIEEPTGPTAFLELPWRHDGLTFNDAAMAINSYFDHEYPLLSRLSVVPEPATLSATLTNFRGVTASGSALPYSSHDGYDYGRIAKATNNDPVLAAASGSAMFVNSCGACGNAIHIDHGNGYQTRYYHLQKDDLISTDSAKTVFVNAGDQIGKVGSTGKSTGAHIHFMVVQDKDGDGNFDNNIPDGIIDPFGWQSKNQDPWEQYLFTYAGQNKTGSKSYYLWKNKLDEISSKLTSNGGQFTVGRFTFTFPANVVNQDTDIVLLSGPSAQPSASLISLGPTIDAAAKDQSGNSITQFLSNFTMLVNFNQFDISTIDTNTISIYSSMDGINWNREASQVDLNTMTATGQFNHFSNFAVMAQRKDTTPPVTNPVLAGDEGSTNWFRSDVVLNLNAIDNQGGFGVDYAMYRVEGSDWEQYTTPLQFSSEGHYKVEFYSADNDENIEDIKIVEFDIDKTPPEIEIGFNLANLALDLIGKDGSQSASVAKNNINKDKTHITVQDQAGNTLTLQTLYKTKENSIRIELKSLKYNNQPEIEIQKNVFEVSFVYNKTKKNLQNLIQFFGFEKDYGIQFKYNYEKNKTKILTIKNKKEQKEERDGVVLLKLFTQNGKLLHSY